MRVRQRTEKRHQRASRVGFQHVEVPLSSIRRAPTNARMHSEKQIAQIAASIRRFGFTNPILIDENGVLIAGAGRLDAAEQIGLPLIPAIRLSHLSNQQKRALAIADNRIAENASWDRERLALEFKELALDFDLELEITGFSTAEIDLLLDPPSAAKDEDEDLPEIDEQAVSRVGDLWEIGKHRLAVGDVRNRRTLLDLMGTKKADAVFTDPPYNVKIGGNVRSEGRTRHREFAVASGEMTTKEFDDFLRCTLGNMAAVSANGSIAFVCMDWRHIEQLIRVGRDVYAELKNLVVWAKTNAGLGTLYRSQHELVAVFKLGTKAHQNYFKLGQDGRWRSNLWQYQGVNSFGPRRREELDIHPTVKPVPLVADAIKDVTRRGQIVLDGFAGSGTTLIAAEKTGRICRAVELDPLYADAIVRRWEKLTGEMARHARTGRTFQKTADIRLKQVREREDA